MKLYTLEDLYVDELKDIYSAENQLVKALPKMAKGASSPELKEAFEMHLAQTKGHVDRIEKIFEGLKGKPRGKKCAGMEGLITEGSEILEEKGAGAALDAGLIGAAQRVEHYEIAAYGTARAHARQLGFTHDAELLQQTLDEEKAADDKLTTIAESLVNWRAEDRSNGGNGQVMAKGAG